MPSPRQIFTRRTSPTRSRSSTSRSSLSMAPALPVDQPLRDRRLGDRAGQHRGHGPRVGPGLGGGHPGAEDRGGHGERDEEDDGNREVLDHRVADEPHSATLGGATHQSMAPRQTSPVLIRTARKTQWSVPARSTSERRTSNCPAPRDRAALGRDAAVVLDLPAPGLARARCGRPRRGPRSGCRRPTWPASPSRRLPVQEPPLRTSSSPEALTLDGSPAARRAATAPSTSRVARPLTTPRSRGRPHRRGPRGRRSGRCRPCSRACAARRTTRWPPPSSTDPVATTAPLSLSFHAQVWPALLLSISASTSIRPSSALALIFQSVLALHDPERSLRVVAARRRRRGGEHGGGQQWPG